MGTSLRGAMTSLLAIAAASVCAAAAVPTWAAVATSAPSSAMVQQNYTMTITPATQEQMFQASQSLPVFLVFGGPKCGGCKAFRALQDEMAPKQRNFVSAYADTNDNPTLVAKYGIRLAPEIIVIWKGEGYVRELGWPGEKTARKWINDTIDAIRAGKPAPGTPMPGSPTAPPVPTGPPPSPTFTQPFPGTAQPSPTFPQPFPGNPR